MGIRHYIKTRTEGTAKAKAYENKDGESVVRTLIGALETRILDLKGKLLAATGLALSERVLMLNAIFFQRIVSRTPRDESYQYINALNKTKYHIADKDYIQDYWVAKYWNFTPITVPQLRDLGCKFETFDDSNDIQIIYEEFKRVFFGKEGSKVRQGKRSIGGVRIMNDHPNDKAHNLRYHLLEYGGYVGDGIIKTGAKNYHGVVAKRSVQAPAGMTALTEAEMKHERFTAKTENITKYLGKVKKVKNPKELKKLLGNKVTYTQNDIDMIRYLYGV